MNQISFKVSDKINGFQLQHFLDDVDREALNQIHMEQRKKLLLNLDLLKSSVEAVKELMV